MALLGVFVLASASGHPASGPQHMLTGTFHFPTQLDIVVFSKCDSKSQCGGFVQDYFQLQIDKHLIDEGIYVTGPDSKQHTRHSVCHRKTQVGATGP